LALDACERRVQVPLVREEAGASLIAAQLYSDGFHLRDRFAQLLRGCVECTACLQGIRQAGAEMPARFRHDGRTQPVETLPVERLRGQWRAALKGQVAGGGEGDSGADGITEALEGVARFCNRGSRGDRVA